MPNARKIPLPFKLPKAPGSIQKGSTLKDLLDKDALDCLLHNIGLVHPGIHATPLRALATRGLKDLGLMDRGRHWAAALRASLPPTYGQAMEILLASLTPPLETTGKFGLGVFFYLPHVFFVAEYGLDTAGNGGRDPFDLSMRACRELTMRFSAEFCIRPFLIHEPKRTFQVLGRWVGDANPHVRRLCSEGTRPRLPWAQRLPDLIRDPGPVLPILERLKDDPELYVRRSVANHLGDLAKDHPDLVFDLCERWLRRASSETRWLIRHALRHPDKKGVSRARALRRAAA